MSDDPEQATRKLRLKLALEDLREMKGFGTDDRMLTRTIVSRCEVDMVEIKAAFEKMYGKSLARWIKSDCSGSYKTLLLVLIRES